MELKAQIIFSAAHVSHLPPEFAPRIAYFPVFLPIIFAPANNASDVVRKLIASRILLAARPWLVCHNATALVENRVCVSGAFIPGKT